ncbi:MAG: hypothetical protein U0610_16875 [bacterium]
MRRASPDGIRGRTLIPGLIAADALATVALAYRGIDRLLLGISDALPLGAAATSASLSLGAAAALALASERLCRSHPARARAARWWEAPASFAGVAVLAVILGEHLVPLPTPLANLTWDWHALVGNLDASMHVSRDLAKAALAIWLSLVWALALDGPVSRGWTRLLLTIWGASAVGLVFRADALAAVRPLAALLALLPLIALALAESGRPHGAARVTLAAALLSFVGLHASGLAPLSARGRDGALADAASVAAAEGSTALPVAALAISQDGRLAAAALTSDEGLAQIDLASGQAALLGLGAPVAALAVDARTGTVAARAPQHRVLLTLRLEPLTVLRSVLVPGHPIGSLSAVAARSGRVLLANRPGAGLDEYALDTLSFVAEHPLSSTPDAALHYVATQLAADPATGAWYAAVASVETTGDRQLTRIEPGRNGKRITAPIAGADALAVAAHPGGGSRVFVANARTGTIQMLDGETLALLREARGPVDVRAVAWEPRREVLLAMGRMSRQLAAVDLRLGRTVKASALAAVPRAMVLDFQHDRVLVGGDRGLLAVDLTRWLYPAPAAGAR